MIDTGNLKNCLTPLHPVKSAVQTYGAMQQINKKLVQLF